MYSGTSLLWIPETCRGVLIQGLICTQKCTIGTLETVLIREVSLFQVTFKRFHCISMQIGLPRVGSKVHVVGYTIESKHIIIICGHTISLNVIMI